MRKRINYGSQEFDTYVWIGGEEFDVCVHYDTSPAEPDVNWAGGLDITAVYLEDQGCVMDDMTDEEFEQLEMRVNEHENRRTDPYEEH